MLKKILLAFATALVVSILAEVAGHLTAPGNFDSAYREFLAPTQIDETKKKTELERDLYDLKRHLTYANEQPKTPHPYLGFVSNRSLDPRVNREGFRDPHEYPYQKKPDEFVVGIFGGSVALNFALYQFQMQERGKETLAQRLEKVLARSLHGKKIVLLNFGAASYKQPQQFFAASMFIESVDMAINIDGYNEVKNWAWQEFPVIFPTYSNMFFSKDLARQQYWMSLINIRQRQFHWTNFIHEHPILAKSSLVFFGWKAFMRVYEQKIRSTHESFVANADYRFPYYKEPPTAEQSVQWDAEVWEKYTRLENALLKSQKKPAFFFIQPNQYVPESKSFSEEEKRDFVQANDYTPHLIHGYELLLKSAARLRKEGVEVFDLTGIFKGHPETLYEDNCCHFNFEGDKILEDAIVEKIAAVSTH